MSKLMKKDTKFSWNKYAFKYFFGTDEQKKNYVTFSINE